MARPVVVAALCSAREVQNSPTGPPIDRAWVVHKDLPPKEGGASRGFLLKGSIAYTHNSLLLVKLKDVGDLGVCPGMLSDYASHKLSSTEHDITSWF